jgi:hypothetical protein
MPVRRFLPLLLLALAGCAFQPVIADARLSDELLRVAQLALATADGSTDIRTLVRTELNAGHGRHRLVFIGGHRFLVEPATVDRLKRRDLLSPRYQTLTSQSIQLAEQGCFAFLPAEGGDQFRAVRTGPDSISMTVQAEGVQLVNVGIELRRGCVVAIHIEQASAEERN